jgi:hypothetical protein
VDQSKLYKLEYLPPYISVTDLAHFCQTLMAGEALAGLSIVMIGNPIQHDFSRGLQAFLFHCERSHVMRHSFKPFLLGRACIF